jgi:hypothetical protein
MVMSLPVLVGCSPNDPITDDIYTEGTIFVWDGTAYQPVTYATGNVSATTNLGDNKVKRGDGGGAGVQDSLVSINDFGTLSAPAVLAGNIDSTGKVEADRLIGDIEGYSIDVVQASDLDIAVNDTLDIVFLFEPDVIVLDFSARVKHDTTFEVGHTTGHCVLIVTGVDTVTHNLNVTSIYNDNGSMSMTAIQNNATRAIWAYGGNDGIDDSYINASAGWDTSTHTLTLTFVTVSNTLENNNFVEIVATAYR